MINAFYEGKFLQVKIFIIIYKYKIVKELHMTYQYQAMMDTNYYSTK